MIVLVLQRDGEVREWMPQPGCFAFLHHLRDHVAATDEWPNTEYWDAAEVANRFVRVLLEFCLVVHRDGDHAAAAYVCLCAVENARSARHVADFDFKCLSHEV